MIKNTDIYSLASNENTLYCGCNDKNIRRIKLDNLDEIAPIKTTHTKEINNLVFSDDKLVSGSKDSMIKIWDINTKIQ